jgi:hypothetical protein
MPIPKTVTPIANHIARRAIDAQAPEEAPAATTHKSEQPVGTAAADPLPVLRMSDPLALSMCADTSDRSMHAAITHAPAAIPAAVWDIFRDEARKGVLCADCRDSKNVFYNSAGQVVKAFCVPCRSRLSGFFACKATPNCPGHCMVSGMGVAEEMCRRCAIMTRLYTAPPGLSPISGLLIHKCEQLCSHCVALKNVEYDEYGNLCAAFCHHCIRVLTCAPENACPRAGCQFQRPVNMLGMAPPFCGECMHYDATVSSRNFAIPPVIVAHQKENTDLPSSVWNVLIGHLDEICDLCASLRNVVRDKKGVVTRVFCESCCVRIANFPEYVCEGVGADQCGAPKWVSPLGTAAPLCRKCDQERYAAEKQPRKRGGRRRNGSRRNRSRRNRYNGGYDSMYAGGYDAGSCDIGCDDSMYAGCDDSMYAGCDDSMYAGCDDSSESASPALGGAEKPAATVAGAWLQKFTARMF